MSYSHVDNKWRERVRVHLRPLEKQGILELFDDSKIDPGDQWHEEIVAALDRAKVAILLVSADFIASDFIAEDELPPLLKKAESGGATIIPVIVSPCGFRREKRLSRYQSVNKPEEPLEGLTYSESEQVLAKLADAVENALQHPDVERRDRTLRETPAHSAPKTDLQSESAKELLQLIESEPDSDKRGLTEILDSPEPGQTFFLPGLRDGGSPFKMKSRLFREGVSELVSREWLYPPEDTGETRLYEFKPL